MEDINLDWLNNNRTLIRQRFEKLCLEDQMFADAVSRATANKSNLKYRLSAWCNALEELGAVVPHKHRIQFE
jgi:hypothetical protein